MKDYRLAVKQRLNIPFQAPSFPPLCPVPTGGLQRSKREKAKVEAALKQEQRKALQLLGMGDGDPGSDDENQPASSSTPQSQSKSLPFHPPFACS